jgi:hypothetical protein
LKPLIFVVFQLVVLGWAYFARVQREPSALYRALWLAAICGVIGLDIWYLLDSAYPAGFKF